MLTLFQESHPQASLDLQKRIRRHLEKLPTSITPIGSSQKILRFEFPCEMINCLSWLALQNSDQKIYWGTRDDREEIAGVGEMDVVSGDAINYTNLFTLLQKRLSANNPHLRYYGGSRFTQKTPTLKDNTWKKFKAYRFIIPRFELLRINDTYTFACNIALNEITPENIETILTQLDALIFIDIPQQQIELPNINTHQDFPNKQEWQNIFKSVRTQLDAHIYEKIVLAKKSILTFNQTLDPFMLMRALKERTPQCFHFCFSPQKNKAFLGASPERLYKRNKEFIETEAIAGTRPRGENASEDKTLSTELCNSAKDSKEHQYVVDFLQKRLSPLCTTFSKKQRPQLLTLKGGYHLITRFDGKLKKEITDDQILSTLHPTPAVAGYPQDKALEHLVKYEPFDRGLYAAPVGYVGYDTTEFIVAIRCGLVQDDQLSLFAGAGIIQESNCQAEWDEIENKMGNFIKIFHD